ncbi:MAG: winged helix-turn-helix transcriptional regulator [Thermoplasmatota archaeon]
MLGRLGGLVFALLVLVPIASATPGVSTGAVPSVPAGASVPSVTSVPVASNAVTGAVGGAPSVMLLVDGSPSPSTSGQGADGPSGPLLHVANSRSVPRAIATRATPTTPLPIAVSRQAGAPRMFGAAQQALPAALVPAASAPAATSTPVASNTGPTGPLSTETSGGGHAAPPPVTLPFTNVTPVEVAGLFSAGLVTAAAVYFWPFLRYGFIGLYARIQPPDILNNELRNGIYALIVQNPGISARELQRQSNASWGTVVYHLRQLEHHHLVRSQGVGRLRAFYEAGPRLAGLETGLALLWNERLKQVAGEIVRHPGATQETLVAATGIPQRTVSHYLQKLDGAGLLEERRDGRRASYHPGPSLVRVMSEARHGATPTVVSV